MLPTFSLAGPLITQLNHVIFRMAQFQLLKTTCPWYLKTCVLQIFLPPSNGAWSSPSPDFTMFLLFVLLRLGRSAISDLGGVRNPVSGNPESEAMDSGFIKPYQLFALNQNDQFFTIPLSSALWPPPSPWWPTWVVTVCLLSLEASIPAVRRAGSWRWADIEWSSASPNPVTHFCGHSQMERQKEAMRKTEKVFCWSSFTWILKCPPECHQSQNFCAGKFF